MSADSRACMAEALRGRILRAIRAGSLRAGDRLPSARALVREFGIDQRLILDAYRRLADEGLVELRRRGGIYVAPSRTGSDGTLPLPETWLAGVLTDALAHEIPGPELHEWLRRSTETLRLRAVVITSTSDQSHGLGRELRDDFGLEAEELDVDAARTEPPPAALRRADLIVTTPAHADWVRPLADALHRTVCVIEVDPDLRVGEWTLLLRRPIYAVVATSEFADMLRRFFADVPGVENLRVLVLGRDDLSAIPDAAPTYVTQRAREALGGAHIPGRILPPARTIARESARELFAFIVRANVGAMTRRER